MTTKTKAARHSGNCDTRQNVHGSADSFILPDEREHSWQVGCDIAGVLLGAMFVFLAIGAVMFGW